MDNGFKDLGKKHSAEEAEPAVKSNDRTYYPSLYINSDFTLDLPESGEAVIRFKRVSETKTTSTGRGSSRPSYSCELEVQGIKVTGGAKPKAKEEGGLSKALDEVVAKKSSDEEGYTEE